MALRLRCAIYTRKSSEEGLDQSFNSLHAQREACEAYVLSQAGEGWSALSAQYDDGGFSGGSMDRPGLAALLADIGAGKVDVVVVYKVDRLTRSLADFAKIVEAFDAKGVSFVSVTQAFNTTTSMGRLTLNVLLSFAQFEREVTGERIRDKIAASKAKGMWMGGMPPLGYDVQGRQLIVNPTEADLVRRIYRRYLDLASAYELMVELDRDGVRSKAWTSRAGKPMGGSQIYRGGLFHILKSRVYLGEIVHKDKVYPGQHAPIVDREMFDQVAAKLAGGTVKRGARAIRAAASPLTGKVFDHLGQPMSPAVSYGKSGKLYRYYVSTALQAGKLRPGEVAGVKRVSAPTIEEHFLDLLRRLSGRPLVGTADLAGILDRAELRPADTHLVLNAEALVPGQPALLTLDQAAARLLTGEHVVAEAADAKQIRLVLPHSMRLRGRAASIVGSEKRKIDRTLVRALRRAHADLETLGASPLTAEAEFARAAAPISKHGRDIARLALMAPTLQQRILGGDAPAGLTLQRVLRERLPLAWADQTKWAGLR